MKQLVLTVLLAIAAQVIQAQEKTFQLSTHILDVSQGKPAPGVAIRLEKWNEQGKTWMKVDEKRTDTNGRVQDLLPGNDNSGRYKLIFYTKDYFASQKTDSFYPFIEVVFELSDSMHYHVPITVSPFGYATYRGS